MECRRQAGRAGVVATALVLFLAPVLASSGPRPLSQLSHRAWQTEDGLPQNSALSLAQTPDGYLWAGTWEGLLRFDGARFVTFDRYTAPRLQANAVRALAPSHRGGLWVGGPLGVEHLRGAEVEVLPPGPREVRALLDDGETLWVGTHRRGLWALRPEGWEQRPGVQDAIVVTLVKDAAGALWLGSDRGLFRMEPGGLPTAVPLPGQAGPVEALSLAHDGRVWACTREGQLFLLGPDGSITRRPLPDIASLVVQVMLEDAARTLWFGTLNGGVLRLAGERLSVMSGGQGLVADSVESILEDAEGNVWVGTEGGGLHRFKEGVALPFGVDEGLPVSNVSAIFEADDGTLWIGTLGGGVVKRSNGEFIAYGPVDGLETRHIRSIGQGADGSLWFGARNGFIWRMSQGRFEAWDDTRGVSWTHHRSFARDTNGELWVATEQGLARLAGDRFELLPASQTLCPDGVELIEPARDGGLWLVSEHGALVRMQDGIFTEVIAEDPALDLNPSDLHEDASGTLWVGTRTGLVRVRNGSLVQLTRDHGLPDDVVFSVLEDGTGMLWTSSNRGVFRMPLAELEQVARGERDRVTAEAFGADDGMRSAEANGSVHPPGLSDRAGQLWFPTIRGLANFEPVAASASPPLKALLVEQVRVDGVHQPLDVPLRLSSAAGRLEVDYTTPHLRAAERVRFRYRMRGVDHAWVQAGTRRTAHYTRLPPGRWTFEVEAVRHGEPWSRATSAAFTLQVPPRISETWWFRTAALLLAMLLVGAVVAWRLRTHRVRERELEARVRERTAELASTNARLDAQFQALQEAKARLVHAEKMAAVGTLAAGVGHEINNPLAYILNSVYFARATIPQLVPWKGLSEDRRQQLEDVQGALGDALEGVERVRKIVLDLRAFSRAEPDEHTTVSLAKVLDFALNIAAVELRHRARVVRTFESVPEVLGDATRLGQLFLNLLMNAAQALPEGWPEQHELRVRLFGRDEEIIVEIEDTGPGIPPEILPRIFEPFFTTKPVGLGMGMGLSICHAIAQAHQGSIRVETRLGEGTTFRITLPAAPDQPAMGAAS